MIRPLVVALLVAGCSKPYAQTKSGDLDVDLVWSYIACSTKENKIDNWRPGTCKRLQSFRDATAAVATPKKDPDRYLGWLHPIGNQKAGFPVGVALIVEKKNGRAEATMMVIEDANESVFREVVAGDRTDGLDRYFVRKDVDVSRRLDRIEGSSTSTFSIIGASTYIRRDGDRLLLVHISNRKNDEIHYGRTYAPVWVGELRRVE
jgi:hypothetical protein